MAGMIGHWHLLGPSRDAVESGGPLETGLHFTSTRIGLDDSLSDESGHAPLRRARPTRVVFRDRSAIRPA